MTRKFVSKGWGWEDWICNSELYCGKRMFCKQGKECSLHYHKLKDETFLIESGKLFLEYYNLPKDMTCEDELNAILIEGIQFFDKKFVVLRQGDIFHIPPLMRHRFIGSTDCYFTEFSTEHFDSDSYRLIKGD